MTSSYEDGPGASSPDPRRDDPGESTDLPLSPREVRRLEGLLGFLEDRVPEPYRVRILAHLLPRVLPVEEASADRPGTPEDPLEPYRPLLEQRGETLLKALVALRLGEILLELEWMSPREIVDLLRDDAGARSLYRSNVSNALREASGEVRRRRRGRGFEYSLSARGRGLLDREVRLARGIDDTQGGD